MDDEDRNLQESHIKPLPQDGDSPASPAKNEISDLDDDPLYRERTKLDPTHPVTDSSMQEEEIYEGGIAAAAGASEPNPDNAVLKYTPLSDEENLRPQENPDI